MNREKFLDLLQEARTPAEALNAMLDLYDLVVEFAGKAEAMQERTLRWSEEMYKIQQLLVWSPLRLFWQPLTEDELLPIRAAAKGNITERTGEFLADPEVGLMAHAILPIMLSQRIAEVVTEALLVCPEVRAAQKAWSNGNIPVCFEPILRVTLAGPATE